MTALLTILLLIGSLGTGQAQRSFVTAFLENINRSALTKFQLYLVTYDKPATVSVFVLNPPFSQMVFIERDSSSLVSLDFQYMISEKQVVSKAVMVTSDEDISVFGFYTSFDTADAMACLPAEDLGTEYYIVTSGGGHANQFAVANGRYENITLEITVSGSIDYNGVQYGNQERFSVTLEYQQVVQFQSAKDLTGTRVVSTSPVAVFSGNKCFTGINTLCDALVEQLYPVENWGTFFGVYPLLHHTQDVIDIIAASPNTTVTVEKPMETLQYHLQQGSRLRLTLEDRIIVNSSKAIMICYLFRENIPGIVTNYDPFFVTVPPASLTRKYYKFITQDIYYNFILIVSPAPSIAEFYLDHQPISHWNVSMREINGLKGWEVVLGKISGQHEIYHESLGFVIYVYGIETYISYGYSMGQESTYPDPPLPESTEDPAASDVLRCLSDGAVYHLSLSLLHNANLAVRDVHLEDPLCRAEQDGSSAFIKIPFNRCGSRVLYEDGKTFYENTVYGTIPETSIHRIEIPVKCGMETDESLGLLFHPRVTDVVSLGHYNISMKLFQNDSFDNPIETYPYEADLHGKLYVGFKVESNDGNLQILVDNCRSSPSLEDSEQTYYLIQHGCLLDSTLHSHPVSDQREKHFSFHIFKFEDSSEVYLSCDVITCHSNTTHNRCNQGCTSQRQRRSVFAPKTQLGSAKLSQGPIVFKQDDTLLRAENLSDQQDLNTFPMFVFMAALCTVCLLSTVVFILQRRYYRMREYTLLRNN
uniref:ZP domain-containing protein n=2 Tax=Leptobrachium leishanense TaxID=445787 RepID=A0A8C5QWK1_9ANUR